MGWKLPEISPLYNLSTISGLALVAMHAGTARRTPTKSVELAQHTYPQSALKASSRSSRGFTYPRYLFAVFLFHYVLLLTAVTVTH